MDPSACAFSSSVATSNCCRIMAQKWYSSNLFIVAVVVGGSYFGNDPERVESDNKLFGARFTYSFFFLSSSLICGGLAKTRRRWWMEGSGGVLTSKVPNLVAVFGFVINEFFSLFLPSFHLPFPCSKCHKKNGENSRALRLIFAFYDDPTNVNWYEISFYSCSSRVSSSSLPPPFPHSPADCSF